MSFARKRRKARILQKQALYVESRVSSTSNCCKQVITLIVATPGADFRSLAQSGFLPTYRPHALPCAAGYKIAPPGKSLLLADIMEQQRYGEAKGESTEKKPLPNRESDDAHQHETNCDEYSCESRVHMRNPERPGMRFPFTILHGQYSTPRRVFCEDECKDGLSAISPVSGALCGENFE